MVSGINVNIVVPVVVVVMILEVFSMCLNRFRLQVVNVIEGYLENYTDHVKKMQADVSIPLRLIQSFNKCYLTRAWAV